MNEDRRARAVFDLDESSDDRPVGCELCVVCSRDDQQTEQMIGSPSCGCDDDDDTAACLEEEEDGGGGGDDDDPVLQQRKQWRELEAQDEAARAVAAAAAASTTTPTADDHHEDTFHRSHSTTQKLLDYNVYLQTQHYYDDLKHVDYQYMLYDNSILIEQDKRLGKGGMAWDAAHILAEFVRCRWTDIQMVQSHHHHTRMIELGCGTGVCGILLVAQHGGDATSSINMTLTDLPPLMPLVQRNVARNFHAESLVVEWEEDPALIDYWQSRMDDCRTTSRTQQATTTGSTIQVQVLDWATVVEDDTDTATATTKYDVILGADVVASLYDPVALAHTISCLAHDKSIVVVSFKERLSTVHRQFEDELQARFHFVEIHRPPTQCRNRNPDVRILVAKGKKYVCHSSR